MIVLRRGVGKRSTPARRVTGGTDAAGYRTGGPRPVPCSLPARSSSSVIPISKVDVRDAEPLVLEVLRSGALAQGPVVERLERAFAEVVGVRHAVAVNNGTTALVAALQVLGLRPGDEVVTSPFTFAATLNAILEAGATARFADIDEADFAIDPAAVEAVVGDRTAVLMPVHLYGQTADMGPLTAIARRHGLHVVEDAAQAHGAAYEGRGAGSFGLGCFSFYATKNLTTGEGGMITTSDDALADRLRVLRNQGMRERYRYELAGHNYRMTDLHAAVGLPQVARTAEQTPALAQLVAMREELRSLWTRTNVSAEAQSRLQSIAILGFVLAEALFIITVALAFVLPL